MTIRIACVCVLFSIFAGGCGSTGESPLVFGQANTLGISIGASATEQGGDLVLGYKGQNFAVVPVTVGQPDGSAKRVGAKIGADDYLDAYSVLGQFEASGKAGATGQNAALGTFFATGLAAKRLADGFAQKLGEGQSGLKAECKSEDQKEREAMKDADRTAAMVQQQLAAVAKRQAEDAQRLEQQVRSQQAKLDEQDRKLEILDARSKSTAATAERKSNTSLIYAQYQSVGFMVSAAATQQGADLTLGYKDRNFAVIPSNTRDPAGMAAPLWAKASDHYDALSVLGQFEIKGGNDAGTVDVVLGKFFSTGMAAKKLSDGFAARLCNEYQPPQKPQAQKPAPQ